MSYTVLGVHGEREQTSRELFGADVVFATEAEAIAYGNHLMETAGSADGVSTRLPGLLSVRASESLAKPNCEFTTAFKLRWLHTLTP